MCKHNHIVVTELLDSGLLGEDFIPVLRDALRKEWICPSMAEAASGGDTPAGTSPTPTVIIPAAAKVYAQLVESEYLCHMGGLDTNVFRFMTPHTHTHMAGDAAHCPGSHPGYSTSAHVIHPYACSLGQLLHSGEAKVLSDPLLVCAIDFHALPEAGGQHVSINVPCTVTGRMDAVVFWWECCLDKEGDFVLHNKPIDKCTGGVGSSGLSSTSRDNTEVDSSCGIEHQDHWLQGCVLMLDDSNAMACTHKLTASYVTEGDQVPLLVHQNDTTIWFELDKSKGDYCSGEVEGECSGDTHLPHSSMTHLYSIFDTERVSQLNYPGYIAGIRAALVDYMKEVSDQVTRLVVHIGDGPVVPMLVNECATQLAKRNKDQDQHVSVRVMSLDNDEDCVKVCMQHFANEQVLSVCSSSSCPPDWLLSAKGVHLICAEPFFRADAYSKTWGKNGLMRYWQGCHSLGPYLSDDVVLLPRRAVLCVALVQCKELWEAREPVRRPVQGVHVSDLNVLHSYDKIDSLQSWQYGVTLMSNVVDLLHMDFHDNPGDAGCDGLHSIPVTAHSDGTCHALLMWLEYGTKAKGVIDDPASRWSQARPSHTATPFMQGIRYLKNPVDCVGGDTVVHCLPQLNVLDGVLGAQLVVP